MTLLRRKDCKRGMRVKLTHPDKSYNIGESNPAVGSPWECEGTIEGSGMHVMWDTGYSNGYKDGELSPVDDIDTGNCKSIWHNNSLFDDF